MLKKFLKDKAGSENVFPLSATATKVDNAASTGILPVENLQNQRKLSEQELLRLATQLMQQPEFMPLLEQLITPKVLEVLLNKYGFEPTAKYIEEAENKKKYIEQLDEYLKERKAINHTVENDLQNFLKDTTASLSKALESFSSNIHTRIREAENRYGIDAIKNALLAETPQ